MIAISAHSSTGRRGDGSRSRFRHVELNGPKDAGGIQVTVFDQSAPITVPYWHSGDHVLVVFRDIWTCLATLEPEAGFLTYDPQMNQVLRLDVDSDRVLSRYAQVVEFAERATKPISRKPWWNFW